MNSYRQSLYIGIIRVCANLVMIGAVFLAMYNASRWPSWPSEAVFCLCFFGITIPAWTAAWGLTRFVRRRWPARGQSVVDLPGRGRQLVAWEVVNSGARTPLCPTSGQSGY